MIDNFMFNLFQSLLLMRNTVHLRGGEACLKEGQWEEEDEIEGLGGRKAWQVPREVTSGL